MKKKMNGFKNPFINTIKPSEESLQIETKQPKGCQDTKKENNLWKKQITSEKLLTITFF